MALSMYAKKEPSKVRRRAISRASSRRSQLGSGQSKPADRGVSSCSDSENEETRTRMSDLDFTAMDIGDEQAWDTDLEPDDTPTPFDHSGRTAYTEECKKLGVIPVSYFLRHMLDQKLDMRHHGLAASGMRAMSTVLMTNTTILSMDLTDNWLDYEGGLAVCDMLKENCFITDLNLSDNHLNKCAADLCRVMGQNDTLRRVVLAGNGFDDNSAMYFAEFILTTSRMEHLDLSHNQLCEVAGLLLGLLLTTSRIEYLDLSHNQLCEVAGLLLGPAISDNVSIKELNLSWNHLRRKGAMAVATGVKSNVCLKKVNLSWNGFGLEGATALGSALKENSVLEEMDIMNNRITTEGAVLIGKGLSLNETLKVLKMGKNPMQSAGCWGICAAILKNPGCVITELDFCDIMVNRDFEAILQQVQEQLPGLKVTHGGTAAPPKPQQRLPPMAKLVAYMEKHGLRLVDFFSKLDKGSSMSVSRQQFKLGVQEMGIPLQEDEMDVLLNELDRDENGEINYSELVIGQTDFQEKEKTLKMMTTLRPMTS